MPVPTQSAGENQQGINTETPALPAITRQDIINCAFSSWYKRFENVTFESRTISLPETFIDYLNADGIYLPDDGQPRAAYVEEISDDEDSFSESENKDTAEIQKPDFPEIENFIRQSVRELGGAVFPKMNWSSPRDAAWISATQTLHCTSPFDVFLLLKSSDFINHDLNHAFEHCEDEAETSTPNVEYQLVLKKWHNIQPSMEFRVFVKNKEIIGISQRDLNFYEFLPRMKAEIEVTIHNFFEDCVRDTFPSDHYVFDVYIERTRRKVWLIDFNPFSPATDGLLYDWDELARFDTGSPKESEIRIFNSEEEARVHGTNAPRFAINMVPKDVIDLSDGKTVAEFAEEFQRAMVLAERQAEESSSSDDDDDQS